MVEGENLLPQIAIWLPMYTLVHAHLSLLSNCNYFNVATPYYGLAEGWKFDVFEDLDSSLESWS